MFRRPGHILVFVLLALTVLSCGKARVIPRGKLVDIYAEMFLTDQWLRDNQDVKKTADTLLVYEPIFNRYGYTTDDYLKTVEHYMREPDKYAKILKNTAKKLEKKEKEIQKTIEAIERASRLHLSPIHASDTLLRRFKPDSFYLGRPSVHANRYFEIILSDQDRDTLFDGPRLIIKTDSAAVDSVAVDSLNVPIASPDTSGVQSKVIEENDGKIIEVFEAPVRKRQPRIEAQLDTVATE